jgi:processive 1,2-diacylglycerol beta-glucosyltransferase
MPKAFNMGYRAAEQHPDAFRRKSLIYLLLTRGTKKLYRLITEGGYDTIVCTHPFSTLLATSLREKHPSLDVHCSFVATDYTCCPSVNESNIDTYFIPDASLVEDFVCKGIPAERLAPVGIPVRGAFLVSHSREEALAITSLPSDKRHLLMMCGSMGCGPMKEITAKLAATVPEDVLVTVIRGTNQPLYRKLTRRFANEKNVNILGFVKNVSALMDCADLYLTKPGGISVTEASAKQLPMALIHAVAGCEDYNREYLLGYGMAETADTVDDLCKLCVALLNDPDRLAAMRENIRLHAHTDAGEQIFAHLSKKRSDENEITGV